MSNMMLAVLVFYPFLGGIAAWALRGWLSKGKDGFSFLKLTGSALVADFVAVTEFLLMLALFIGQVSKAESGSGTLLSLAIPEICGFGLHFTLDGFRLLYGMIAALMWMMTALLCPEYFSGHSHSSRRSAEKTQAGSKAAGETTSEAVPIKGSAEESEPSPDRFYVFFLLTLGATMGVFLSEDLYTTFIFFEMMSFTSYVWVAHEENNAALRAADTYLAVAVTGGLVMLMGIFGVWHELGTLTISELPAAAAAYGNKPLLYALGGCMLFGFGAKAGAFPLHIWLPKAHPVAPAPASALLSGILTKTGIFGVLAVTSGLFLHDKQWGTLILAIGAATMFGGALLAVFSINLKRTLACSSMSQIGFILIGVGMQCMLGEENALAVHGTLLHMMNHSMIKLVLFMAAGVIYMNAHALDLNVIRGYGRKKPLLKVIFLVGALAIGDIPCFGGYISKTLLHESILEYGGGWIFRALEYLFLLSGGMTVAYMTKLFMAIFAEKNADGGLQKKYDDQKNYMNPASTFALSGSALILLIWGLFPHTIMDKAARIGQAFMGLEEFGETVSYFSWKNLSGGLISIGIGVVVYLFVIRKLLMKKKEYINAWPSWLDLEEKIYRPLLLKVLPSICGAICHVLDVMTDTLAAILIPVGHVLARILDSLTDLSVVGLRKTIYKDSPKPHERAWGNVLTVAIGNVLNAVQALANRTWRRKNPGTVDYRREMALRYDVWRESSTVISRSLSYGLLLVIIGFTLTLVYILWW
ncbi:MAG: complex I subunit 5 family protein [Clostridiales bacterium]|nr:complex I subunit 5 family protein [Clostridiales bacterium]MCC8065634.1 complex I subunit 5 family protein [Clostridiales bacterium]